MKKLITICLIMVVASTAMANLSWQTTPILGTGLSDVTGDVVVITGPTPTGNPDSLDGFYYDEDGNLVLGPTIPHYSIEGDPLFGIGSPSMELFVINPNTWEGGHWVDKVTQIHAGSGINVDPGHTYDWTRVWTYLGPGGSYSMTNGTEYYAPTQAEGGDGFVMLKGYIYDLWLEDIGQWQLTETWTDQAGGEGSFISSTNYFTVIPEPATICMLGLGALSLIRRKK
jgi:hypothetical protein